MTFDKRAHRTRITAAVLLEQDFIAGLIQRLKIGKSSERSVGTREETPKPAPHCEA
jgi:hypothetical protein